MLTLIAQGKSDAYIAEHLRRAGHPMTSRGVRNFTKRISPEERQRLQREHRLGEAANIEELEKSAMEILDRMRENLLVALEAHPADAYLYVSAYSAQVGQWFDRLVKFKTKAESNTVNITVINLTNNINVFVSVVTDVLTEGSDQSKLEAYAEIDKRMKERIGPKWSEALATGEGS